MKIWVWRLIVIVSLFACSLSSVTEQAKLLGTTTFTKKAWAVGSQEQKGEMVYSFLSQHEIKSLSARRVEELLGTPNAYYDYDENLAYLVGPRSVESVYGKGYLLAFIPDKTSGKINAVKIIPEPK